MRHRKTDGPTLIVAAGVIVVGVGFALSRKSEREPTASAPTTTVVSPTPTPTPTVTTLPEDDVLVEARRRVLQRFDAPTLSFLEQRGKLQAIIDDEKRIVTAQRRFTAHVLALAGDDDVRRAAALRVVEQFPEWALAQPPDATILEAIRRNATGIEALQRTR